MGRLPVLFLLALAGGTLEAEPEAFLTRHWQRPLAANGPVPGHFSLAESSLDPSTCGSCHPRQFDDWRTSLHSRAMGPGLMGQLQAMGAGAREEHQACLHCHAPLEEQADHLVQSLHAGTPLPPGSDGVSTAHGLTCAGCHVRGHARFGPPRADGSVPEPGATLPHGGWQVEKAFADARFCSACHQFEPDWPSLNGKPLENTHAEWQASRHAREGRTCQSCHMPGRRHLWRGIHDPEMTRSGLTIDTRLSSIAEGRARGELDIANTATGHAFPTYVTPRVLVEIGQEDGEGRLIDASIERHLIARDVTLDLTAERADTRLMPDERRRYGYDRPLDPRAQALAFRVIVQPDAFYADFYRATQASSPSPQLQEALRQAESSPYELFSAGLSLRQPGD